jgi:hypothetical protein
VVLGLCEKNILRNYIELSSGLAYAVENPPFIPPNIEALFYQTISRILFKI